MTNNEALPESSRVSRRALLRGASAAVVGAGFGAIGIDLIANGDANPHSSGKNLPKITAIELAPPVQLLDVSPPTFIEHPTVIKDAGRLLVAYRYAADGTDTSGRGVIRIQAFTYAGASISGPTTIASDPVLDCRGPRLNRLKDGRLVCIFTTNPEEGGNPEGMGKGPDGGIGNNRIIYQVEHSDPLLATNWSSQTTVQSGFSTTAGFDSTGYSNLVELTAGTVLLPIAGNNHTKTWNSYTDTVGYQLGTYSPMKSIEWQPYSELPPLRSHTTGETSFCLLPDGSALSLWRDSLYHRIISTRLPDVSSKAAPFLEAQWSVPETLNNIGTQVYSQPNTLVSSAGVIYFPSRGSVHGEGNLCYSFDNANTWTRQALDTLKGGYLYGQAIEVSPRQIAVLYVGTFRKNTQLRLVLVTEH